MLLDARAETTWRTLQSRIPNCCAACCARRTGWTLPRTRTGRSQRLAHVSGVSEAHFARSFKQAFGVPPHRYLLTRRIERAMALLRDTDLSITEIAFETGWASLGTFGRTFRDITGESPSAVRSARQGDGACDLGRVPACIVSAAHRPDLTTAVSEKRRAGAAGKNEPRTTGDPMSQGVEVVGLYVRDQDEALAFYVEKARVPRPHGRAQRRLSLADGAAPRPAVVPARPVHAGAAGARCGDGADAARDRGQGRDAAARADRGRLPRRLRPHARAGASSSRRSRWTATAPWTPASAIRRATGGR